MHESMEKAPFFDQILSLSGSSFGLNYLTSNELQHYFNDKNSKLILEFEKEILKGFSIVQLLRMDQLKGALFVNPNWIDAEFSSYHKIGYRKMTAVHEAHKGHGVAVRLYKEAEKWFSGNTDVITSAVWSKKGETTFEPILKKNGFEAIKKVEKYWKEDSLKRGFICPVCGEPPCECDAVIFKKEF